jgi:hypothetical protein
VKVSFGPKTGDTVSAGGGLLLRGSDITQHGDIDRLEVRIDRVKGHGNLMITARRAQTGDATPINVDFGVLDASKTLTLVYSVLPGTFIPHVKILELGFDFRVSHPIIQPPAGGLFGLVTHAEAGDVVSLSEWNVCALP